MTSQLDTDGQPADAPLDVSWRVESPQANVVVAQATVTNIGPAPLRLAGIRWTHEYGRAAALYREVLAAQPNLQEARRNLAAAQQQLGSRSTAP